MKVVSVCAAACSGATVTMMARSASARTNTRHRTRCATTIAAVARARTTVVPNHGERWPCIVVPVVTRVSSPCSYWRLPTLSAPDQPGSRLHRSENGQVSRPAGARQAQPGRRRDERQQETPRESCPRTGWRHLRPGSPCPGYRRMQRAGRIPALCWKGPPLPARSRSYSTSWRPPRRGAIALPPASSKLFAFS